MRTHVITSAHGPPVEEEAAGVEVHRVIANWSFRGGRQSLKRADDVVRRHGIEVLHVFFPDPAAPPYHLVGAIGLGAVPVVTTWWNLGLGRRSPPGLRVSSLALLARSRVLTSHDPGYLRALRLVAVGRPVRMLPVGNNLGERAGAPAEDVRRRFGLGDQPLLGFFGHLDFTRGVEELFAALALLRRRRDVRLLMIGAGASYDAYRRLPRELGIDQAVAWTGYLEPADAADAIAAVDLLVLPYRRNSVGRSALAAALSLGVPTVLGGAPADVEPLVPGRDVAIAPRRDAAALAAAVDELLDDPAARAALAAGARAAAPAFGWPSIAERAEGLYRRVLRR